MKGKPLNTLSLCLFVHLLSCGWSAGADSLTLPTRSRVETSKGSGEWRVEEKTATWDPGKTAIVVCDMWNQHWCKGATRRVAEMAPRMNEVVKEARNHGVFIIHCPSDTMKFYEGTPQRKLAQSAPPATPRVPLQRWCNLDADREAPLPIDDSDGGCDDWPRCENGSPWRRQIDVIEVKEGDAVTDSAEAYYLMQQRGIDNVIVMGVHLNMCVLGRPFSIRQMVKQGKNVVLMRDMTDTMYNSRKRPSVPHCAGTDLMIEHVEKYWCPSITSVALLGGEPFRFSEDKRPHAVLLIGEDEYKTWETLPKFAQSELAPRGLRVSIVQQGEKDNNQFPGLIEALRDADLLLVSTRRRALPREQLDAVRAHLTSGKPLVGIRTASHGFAPRGTDAEKGAAWPEFDPEVLGGNYTGHHGNGPKTAITVAVGSEKHPILTGVDPARLVGNGSLYQVSPLNGSATPLLIGSIPDKPPEPVAWIHRYGPKQARVFYTSLGHPDDFDNAEFRRLLFNGILWAIDRPMPPAVRNAPSPQKVEAGNPPAKVQDLPLAPVEAAASFTVPPDLELEQVLAEPIVAQPVFLNFDERGRMWVVQYRQYPAPAGLKVVSKDGYWRAVYDRVPPPPPNHFKGADKITIHEDTDGDGKFDKHKVFVDGLNIVTSVERGRGGVWVLNPPYLLFYPDANNDDVPDGDPIVHLAGFGLEDTHSVANSLRWGPDGWLYGAQGSTVTGNMIRPGIDKEPFLHTMGQLIWRYHPETRRFEVFAEGGGNAFGCEIDAKGRVFSGHNGGNTRGFHYVQGGYLQKGFEKHGPLSNPYAFGYFPAMPHPDVERFTHNFVVYDGGALPVRYQGKLFGVEPLQGRIVLSEIMPDKSSFRTVDLGHPVTSDDKWFRPVDIKVGPDGAIYICDWYDEQVAHYRNQEGQIDPANGRIYRLKAKGAKPARPFDLTKLSSAELVTLLGNENKWHRQTALRLLADRRDRSIAPQLQGMVHQSSGQPALETLWALYLSTSNSSQPGSRRRKEADSTVLEKGKGANEPPYVGCYSLDDGLTSKLLRHFDPFVRLWTVRLLCDERCASPAIARELAQLAKVETSLEVRGQLVSSARRLPAKDCLSIVHNLLTHDQDADDNRLPMLLWWAIEATAENDREQVVGLFEDSALWNRPLVKQHILDKVMRRYAQAGTRKDLLTCARLFDLSPSRGHAEKLMAGFEAAFKGRSLAGLPGELVKAMARQNVGSVALSVRLGRPEAIEKALHTAADEAAKTGERLDYLQLLSEVKVTGSVPILLKVLESANDEGLRKAALAALQQYDEAQIGERVIALYSKFGKDSIASAETLLASRPAWSLRLAQAVDAGSIKPEAVPLSVVRKIKLHKNPQLAKLADQVWPNTGSPTTAEMEKRIDHLTQVINSGIGNPYKGRTLFGNVCGQCHTLFGQGGQIGPDLTYFKRDDLANMLLGIVNPNAEIREGYENYLVETKDERSLNGFLVDKDKQVVVLRGLDGRNVALEQKDIVEMRAAGMSLMPEGLLDAVTDEQARDLFAYLRSTQPLVAGPAMPK
jgi:putative heme-binding domain-containing protein